MDQNPVVDASELARAFVAARYTADLGVGSRIVRVARTAVELETTWPAESYAFITAWNPASIPCDEETNRRADARLRTRLDESGAGRTPMHAEDAEGRWRETGWLVGGLDCGAVDALARAFGQAGVLYWHRGMPVRLRMLLARPRGADLTGVDWVE